MAGFITQYYARVEYIPSLILVSHWPEDGDLVEKWLADRRGKKLALVLPRRGSRRELVELALENARLSLAEREKREDGARKGLEELKQALGLARIPERIEVYDVSELRGTNKVGSMVVFEGGTFDRSSYRRFKVKSVAGQDDYASLREIVSRRFKRAREGSGESKSGWARIPDLVIVDGG
ncbi:MAG: excinuclease ABC subunit C, partial [Clostridia bacterium]|nr:excinuclease ABC subunit C [Clostridia bacterium]